MMKKWLIEKVRLYTLLIVSLIGSFEDMAIFQLSYDGGGLYVPLQIDR